MNIDYNKEAARKKLIIKISVVFFVVLLLLTFLSNTINNFSLPRVKTEIPSKGALNIYVSAVGNIEAKEVVKKYSKSSREVLKVYAKVGSEVKKGDPIMELDKEDLQSALEQELIQLQKLKLAYKKFMGSITGQKKTEDMEIDIKNYELDIKLQQIKVNNIKKELAEDIVIVAPCNGIIKDIGFERGTFTNSGTALFSIVDVSKGLQFRASVNNESLMRLKQNDLAKITLNSSNRTYEGRIVEMKENSQVSLAKDIIISLPQEDITVNEIGAVGEVRVDITSDNYEYLVPNSAIGDDGKKFVYILKEKKGTLGNEYYARKSYVNVKDQDNTNSGILSGIEQNEQIIVSSNRSNLSDGCRVMLER